MCPVDHYMRLAFVLDFEKTFQERDCSAKQRLHPTSESECIGGVFLVQITIFRIITKPEVWEHAACHVYQLYQMQYKNLVKEKIRFGEQQETQRDRVSKRKSRGSNGGDCLNFFFERTLDKILVYLFSSKVSRLKLLSGKVFLKKDIILARILKCTILEKTFGFGAFYHSTQYLKENEIKATSAVGRALWFIVLSVKRCCCFNICDISVRSVIVKPSGWLRSSALCSDESEKKKTRSIHGQTCLSCHSCHICDSLHLRPVLLARTCLLTSRCTFQSF